MASNKVEPHFAKGEDAAQLGPDMQTLLQQQGWALDADGMGVTKTFYFKSYFKAVVSTAVSRIPAIICAVYSDNPQWTVSNILPRLTE
jgi:pterin-4a-carbinolamine dehydratase